MSQPPPFASATPFNTLSPARPSQKATEHHRPDKGCDNNRPDTLDASRLRRVPATTASSRIGPLKPVSWPENIPLPRRRKTRFSTGAGSLVVTEPVLQAIPTSHQTTAMEVGVGAQSPQSSSRSSAKSCPTVVARQNEPRFSVSKLSGMHQLISS